MLTSILSGRIETNRILAKAIGDSKVKPDSFITMSGVGYYEPHKTNVYTEDWKQPSNRLVEGNYFMNLAKDWEDAGNLDDTSSKTTRRIIIRSGVVLGSDGGMVANLKPLFVMGLGQTFGNYQNRLEIS